MGYSRALVRFERYSLLGSSQIEWRDIALVILWASGNKMSCLSVDGQFRGIPEMFRAENFILGPQSLLEILDASRGGRATDPRDRIFALLGMTEIVSGPVEVGWHKIPAYGYLIFEPDYSLPLREVYISTSRTCLSKTDHFELLSFVDHDFPTPGNDHLSDLPNWAPRWQGRTIAEPMKWYSYKAAKSIKTKLHPASEESELVLEGIVVDKIQHAELVLPSLCGPQDMDATSWQLGCLKKTASLMTRWARFKRLH